MDADSSDVLGFGDNCDNVLKNHILSRPNLSKNWNL